MTDQTAIRCTAALIHAAASLFDQWAFMKLCPDATMMEAPGELVHRIAEELEERAFGPADAGIRPPPMPPTPDPRPHAEPRPLEKGIIPPSMDYNP